MKLQNSYIFIDRMRLHAFHGVMEQERRVGADFEISLRVQYNLTRAMESDDVADTLNYAELCQLVSGQMSQPSQLLEHVAGRVAHAVLDSFPQATAVWLKLTKLNPPMGADCQGAGVEVEVISDK